MTNDEIDAAIRAAVPAECFKPNAVSRALYLAGFIDGIDRALGREKPATKPATEPATEPATLRALADWRCS